MIYKIVTTIRSKVSGSVYQWHEYHDTTTQGSIQKTREAQKQAKKRDIKRGTQYYYRIRPIKKEGIYICITL